MGIGDKVVILARKWLRGEIVGMTREGNLLVELGFEEPCEFKPFDLELEERDDLWMNFKEEKRWRWQQ